MGYIIPAFADLRRPVSLAPQNFDPTTLSILFTAVGDLQLGDSPTCVGHGFLSRHRTTELAEAILGPCEEFLRADVLFGNLETTLSPAGDRSISRNELQMRGIPRFASSLRAAGFDVVNVANNHTMQHGSTAFKETAITLDEAGVKCCGLRGTGPWSSKPVRIRRHGIDLGLLGYSLRPRHSVIVEPLYAEGTRDGILRDVSRLRAELRNVVVSLHWGEEFVPVPSAAEMRLGHEIIEAGAAVIVGHHPHVVRPIERHGDGIIAYSLGNFIGDMVWYEPFRTGAILRCSIGEGGARAADAIHTHLNRDFLPVPHGTNRATIVPQGELIGLDEKEYANQISRTWRWQRFASYRHALLNSYRTPLPILGQLLRDTMRNKLAAVTRYNEDSLNGEFQVQLTESTPRFLDTAPHQ